VSKYCSKPPIFYLINPIKLLYFALKSIFSSKIMAGRPGILYAKKKGKLGAI
jgi:hypothetical protein